MHHYESTEQQQYRVSENHPALAIGEQGFPGIDFRQEQQKGPLLNKKEAAAYLGIKVSTLSAWISKGVAPRYSRLGTRVLFRAEWLDEFVEANAVAP